MTINTDPRLSLRQSLMLRWFAAVAVVVVAAMLLRVVTQPDSPRPEAVATTSSLPTPDPGTERRAQPRTDASVAPQAGEQGPVAELERCDVGDAPGDALKAAVKDVFADGTLDCDPFQVGSANGDDTSGAGEVPPVESADAVRFELPEGWTALEIVGGYVGYLSPDEDVIVFGAVSAQGGATLEDWATAQLSGVMDVADEVVSMDISTDRFLDRDALRADVDYVYEGQRARQQVFMFEDGDRFGIVGADLRATSEADDDARFEELRRLLETATLPR